ncbi:unnamed protein product [Cuscuta campestris]|uniref:Ubiquitin-like protease family profile domain-containing protein n=1 Tax=Cuscuta campestris TaxID=132261 RepID=A0A484LZ62_9ASTE|nr:unnamed protein product [Cuscuta campestris]
MRNMEVLKYNDVILSASDVDALGSHCYLNDQVIRFYFSYLSSLCSQDDVAFVPPLVSFFWQTAMRKAAKMLWITSNWATSALFYSLSTIVTSLVRVRVDHVHWTIFIFDRTKHSFLHLDTMQGENHIPAFKLYDSVKQYVGVESDSIKEGAKNKKKNKNKKKAPNTAVASIEVSFKECEAPQQTNGYDCGVYVMAIAEAVSDFCLSGKTYNDVDWLSFVVKNVDGFY